MKVSSLYVYNNRTHTRTRTHSHCKIENCDSDRNIGECTVTLFINHNNITTKIHHFENHVKIFGHTVAKSSRSLICADKLNAVSVLVSLFKLSFANEGFKLAESFISLINPAMSSSGSISCVSPTTSISINWLSVMDVSCFMGFSSSNCKDKYKLRNIHNRFQLNIGERYHTFIGSSLHGDGKFIWNTQLESKITGTGSWHSMSARTAPHALNKTWCWSCEQSIDRIKTHKSVIY